jgi:uncharacterized protein YaaQ
MHLLLSAEYRNEGFSRMLSILAFRVFSLIDFASVGVFTQEGIKPQLIGVKNSGFPEVITGITGKSKADTK